MAEIENVQLPTGHPESYPIKGRVPVSLATSAGTFDQTFTLDKVAEEIPF